MTTTKRVATTGATGGSSATIGGRTWGGSWGGTWGMTFNFATPAVPASGASPEINATSRVTGGANGGTTRRVGSNPSSTITKRV